MKPIVDIGSINSQHNRQWVETFSPFTSATVRVHLFVEVPQPLQMYTYIYTTHVAIALWEKTSIVNIIKRHYFVKRSINFTTPASLVFQVEFTFTIIRPIPIPIRPYRLILFSIIRTVSTCFNRWWLIKYTKQALEHMRRLYRLTINK